MFHEVCSVVFNQLRYLLGTDITPIKQLYKAPNNNEYGKLHLLTLNFGHFCKYPIIFKTSHLCVSMFGFLSFCQFCTKNPNGMPNLPQNYALFWERYSFGVRGKIGIAKNFLYGIGQSERKLKFDTPKWKFLNIGGVSAKTTKIQEDKWSFP